MPETALLTEFIKLLPQGGLLYVFYLMLRPIIERLGKLVESSTEAHVKSAAAIGSLKDAIDDLPVKIHQMNAYGHAATAYRPTAERKQ